MKHAKQSIRQIMAPVHTWLGLLLGWLLFLIFIMGSLSYFQKEISIWSVPFVHQKIGKTDEFALVQASHYALTQQAKPEKIIINAGSERQALNIDVVPAEGWEHRLHFVANQDGGFSRIDGHSHGGDFFYRLHFDLYYLPITWARYLVGLAAVMMLLALITGIIIHKKIFADFFTFRGKKGQRSWLDAHNALSVIPLPFHLMITFTGIMTLAHMYLPLGEKAASLADDVHRPYYALDWWATPPTNPMPKPMPDILPLINQSKQAWGVTEDYAISTLSILFPKTQAMQISLEHLPSKQFSYTGIFRVYDAQGNFIRQNPQLPSGITANQAIIGMHTAHLVSYPLRFVFFVLGLSGAAMVATGLVLWTVKRRPTQQSSSYDLGFWLVESLNIGTIMGIPLAIISFLLANRLLPLHLHDRASVEIVVFFGAWAFAVILALFAPKQQAWIRLSHIIAIACVCLPIINALTTDRHLLVSIADNDWVFVGIDCSCLFFAWLFWHIGHRIKNHRNPPHKTKHKG